MRSKFKAPLIFPQLSLPVESGRADATTGTEATVRMALESANSDKLEFVEDFEQPDIEGVPSYGAAAFHPEDNQILKVFRAMELLLFTLRILNSEKLIMKH